MGCATVKDNGQAQRKTERYFCDFTAHVQFFIQIFLRI